MIPRTVARAGRAAVAGLVVVLLSSIAILGGCDVLAGKGAPLPLAIRSQSGERLGYQPVTPAAGTYQFVCTIHEENEGLSRRSVTIDTECGSQPGMSTR